MAGSPTACPAPGACTLARTCCSSSTTSRSPSRSVTLPRMMLLSPMNRATSSVAGFVAIVSGSATCWMRASFMTTMRSAIESASSWLCVTWMNIRPSWRWRLRSSTRIRSWSRRSRSPSGSSRSSAFGFVTRTRASATRCCWPPESALGFRSARGVRPTISSASNASFRRSSLPTPCILRPNSTFVEHRPVREEGEVLEDGRRRPLVRGQVDERLAVEHDVAVGRELVAADHPQRRRLAAARRPEQDDVLAVVDVQVDVVDGDGAAGEDLRQADEVEPGAGTRWRGGGGCRPLCLRYPWI